MIQVKLASIRLFLVAFAMAWFAQASPGWAKQTEPLPMEPLFQLNPTEPGDLAQQSRVLANPDVDEVWLAGSGVLQDMGYKLTGGEQAFGLLLGEKNAEVSDAGIVHAISEAIVVTITVLLSIAGGQDVVTDLPEQIAQRIYVSLLVTGHTSGGTLVRISLDRDMYYDNGWVIPDHTELPLVYQEFFDRLSKAIFLEGEQL